MIKPEAVYEIMRDGNSPFWRIKDLQGNTLDVNKDIVDMTSSIERLKTRFTQFSNYSQLTVLIATTEQLKASWTGCNKLLVMQSQAMGHPSTLQPITAGEMEAKIAVERMNMQFELYKKDQVSTLERMAEKFAPHIGIIFAKMAGMDLSEVGLSGLEEEEEIGTEVEEQSAEEMLSELCKNPKIGKKRMIILLKALKKKPDLAAKAITFLT